MLFLRKVFAKDKFCMLGSYLIIKIVLILVHIHQYASKNKTIHLCCMAVARVSEYAPKREYASINEFASFKRIRTNNRLHESLFGSRDFALLDLF